LNAIELLNPLLYLVNVCLCRVRKHQQNTVFAGDVNLFNQRGFALPIFADSH
jgi:hypothetical protein